MNIIIVGTAYPLRGGIAHYNALLAEHLGDGLEQARHARRAADDLDREDVRRRQLRLQQGGLERRLEPREQRRGEILERVLENIRQSAVARPRPMRVVFISGGSLPQAPWLVQRRELESFRRCVVYDVRV